MTGTSETSIVRGPKVFITYRREETGAQAGRLYDAMVVRFGENNVFMDVDMAPGVDFVERITEAVATCHVLIVVMGPNWATVKDENGRPRLADPEDFVRLEVEAALKRPEVTPIPVLVAGAKMPDREQVPQEIRAITRRNALELSDLRWRQDVGRLIGTLDELLAEMLPVSRPPSPERGVDAEGTADAARAPGATAPPSTVAPAKPAVANWFRRHLPATIAAAVIAVAGLAVVIFALSQGGNGGSTPVTEAGLPEVIPADIRPNCRPGSITGALSTVPAAEEAGVVYQCPPPYGESQNIHGDATISYLQFPDATAAVTAIRMVTESLRSDSYGLCKLNASDRIRLVYSDGRADCLESASEGVIINWDIDQQRSPVIGSATFDPPTTKEDAMRAWQGILRST